MTRNLVISIVLLAAIPAAQAAVYKCTINGATEFSDRPCAPNAQRHEVSFGRPSEADAAASRERTQQALGRGLLERQRRRVDRQIADAEERRARLEMRRDSELAALRADKTRAANNLAGATWENSIATEMQAVVMRYEPQIKAVIDEITALKARRP